MKKILFISLFAISTFSLNADYYHNNQTNQPRLNAYQPQSGGYYQPRPNHPQSNSNQTHWQQPQADAYRPHGNMPRGNAYNHQNQPRGNSNQSQWNNDQEQTPHFISDSLYPSTKPYSNPSAASATNDTNSKYPQDTFSNDNDRKLNDKIRSKIGGWFTDSYKSIALHSNNGSVTIDGFVETFDDKKNLMDKIYKVEGIRAVVNNVQVKNQNPNQK